MKAIRKSDGKIIKVEAIIYNRKNGERYSPSELDFNVDAEDTVISGWVARDGNGNLWAYTHKPIRSDNSYWLGEVADFTLSNDAFPDLTWDSEPMEVEIIIKLKKK